MITLPKNFTATQFPGYFWDVVSQELFSIKVGGVLRKLNISQPNRWNNYHGPAYRVSVEGSNRLLFLSDLMELDIVDSEIPYK